MCLFTCLSLLVFVCLCTCLSLLVFVCTCLSWRATIWSAFPPTVSPTHHCSSDPLAACSCSNFFHFHFYLKISTEKLPTVAVTAKNTFTFIIETTEKHNVIILSIGQLASIIQMYKSIYYKTNILIFRWKEKPSVGYGHPNVSPPPRSIAQFILFLPH